MGHHLEILEHDNPRLWVLLGPTFCNLKVHKELGGPVYSSSATTWFVVVENDKALGFVSLRQTHSSIWYDYGYVLPEWRNKGIFTELTQAREAHCKSVHPRHVNVRADRWKHYETRGWDVSSKRGSWFVGVRK